MELSIDLFSGERLVILRLASGLNKTDFANSIGVSPTHITDLETFKAKPSFSFAMKVVNQFQTDGKCQVGRET